MLRKRATAEETAAAAALAAAVAAAFWLCASCSFRNECERLHCSMCRALRNAPVEQQQQQHEQQQQQHRAPIFSMGLDPQEVSLALQQFNGDHNLAANALLATHRPSSAPPSPLPPSPPPLQHVSPHRPTPLQHLAPSGAVDEVQQLDALLADPFLAEARGRLRACHDVGQLRQLIYEMLPASARKAGWDTPCIQVISDHRR